ncbi:MAG: hypothetical protein ACXVLQ_01470 [Bacteriovorax sp.]
MKTTFNLVYLILILALSISCSSSPKVNRLENHDKTVVHITAINDGTAFDAIPKKFIVVPANEKDDENDLYFRRFAGMVERMLVERGFLPDPKPGKDTVRIKVSMNFEKSWSAVFGKKTRYQRVVFLKAVRANNKVLWQVGLDSWGNSHNYVKILPRMLWAGKDYLGLAFEGQKKEIVLPEENDMIRKIRGPLLKDLEVKNPISNEKDESGEE